MILERYTAALFIIFMIGFIPITFKILLAIDINQLFKQGRIFEIRMAYIGLSLIFSYLLASSIVAIVERMMVIAF